MPLRPVSATPAHPPRITNRGNRLIVAEGLRKHYGPLKAVDGVSFEIKTGEAFGLLGPNGAGKTTTINLLVGLTRLDGGKVGFVDGIRDRSEIGLAPQTLALYDELTGAENLAFFGAIYGLAGKRLKERVAWGLDFAGLTDRANDRTMKYSGGMKRRLNLACALVHEPKLLVLDEPTVGVDPQSRNHIFTSIEDLKKKGLTVLYTTHYMEEAQRLCDRVAIMDHGKLLALDTVEALLKAHSDGSAVVGETLKPIEGEPPVRGEWNGTEFRIETKNPLETLAALQRAGIETASLHIERPNLESVFLRLTGRSLRD